MDKKPACHFLGLAGAGDAGTGVIGFFSTVFFFFNVFFGFLSPMMNTSDYLILQDQRCICPAD